MMFTLLLPMKIIPRRMLSKLFQQVSKPQLVMARLTPGSLVLKVTVWS